jgi:hypothetical protein
MMHVTLVNPHPHTPTYLLTCGHTYHRTVIDPTHPMQVKDILGDSTLDLILLTSATELTLSSAEILHHRTGAPILAAESFRETALPIARYLTDGEVVGLGPLAQTIHIPDGDILCYAVGMEGVIFTGPLFASGLADHKANKAAIAKLKILPEDTIVCGGGADQLPLGPLLTATHAS